MHPSHRTPLGCAAAVFLALASCGAEPRDNGPTAPPSHASGPAPSASATDAPRAKERVCLPVLACNMFTSCALAESGTDPQGKPAYQVLAYDHHPHRVGAFWPREQVCWKAQGDAREGCSDALLYREVACTMNPGAPLPLDYTCAMAGDDCVATPNPRPPPPPSDNVTTDEVSRVMAELQGTLRSTCWDTLPKNKGPASAKIDVKLTVDPDGSVSNVTASGAKEHPTLAPCVKKVIAGARFPAHPRPTALALPVLFTR